MTNGFHHDPELVEKDQSEQQDEGSVAESATCVAEEQDEPIDSVPEIELDSQS